MEGEMHRTRPGGLNGGEMYGTRAGFGILLLLISYLTQNNGHAVGVIMHYTSCDTKVKLAATLR